MSGMQALVWRQRLTGRGADGIFCLRAHAAGKPVCKQKPLDGNPAFRLNLLLFQLGQDVVDMGNINS